MDEFEDKRAVCWTRYKVGVEENTEIPLKMRSMTFLGAASVFLYT